MVVIVLDVFVMKSSKPIEISRATLIGLKAELSRKQDEVQKVTAQGESKYIPAPVRKEKETILTKQNAGVAERSEKDIQLDVEEIDLQRKSREVLEVKSRLYDKLQQGELKTDNKSLYLVDFEQKAAEESQNTVVAGCENKPSDEVTKKSDEYSSASDSEDDWVDYVDCFGRTRRCLRTDLEHMKSKDAQVSDKLNVNKKPDTEHTDEQQPEMLSADMNREAMRQKWEEQERKLLEKGEIHYQDVLFDEARSHGVGYYNFSVEEEERRRQQAELLKLRKETVEEQAEKQRIVALRQQQLQARLKAAHKRRRERLGLPPEDENEEKEQDTTESVTEKPEEGDQKEQSVEDIERDLKRAAHVRPWDIGKDGVKPQSSQVMSQEEWVEKKREERPSEFAPPSSYTTTDYEPYVNLKEDRKALFFTSKKMKRVQEHEKPAPVAQPDNDDSDDDSDYGPSVSDWKKQKLSSEYNKTQQEDEEEPASEHSQIRQELSDSISAGLDYLRQQADIKQKKKQKGLLDIM